MIEVNHITKRFGKVTAVDDFTLDINRGSVLGIVGSNGGGKSTLLRILSGVFDADSGEVKINGQNIYNNPSVKGECFFIPDFPYFFKQCNTRKHGISLPQSLPELERERFQTILLRVSY